MKLVFLCASESTGQNDLFPLAEGIRLAEIDDVAWVFHVDTDELMYPAGAGEFSLQVSNHAAQLIEYCSTDSRVGGQIYSIHT